MKKEDSVIVNIVSVAGILAALAVILVVFVNGQLFTGIVDDINHATDGYYINATVYDVCYYKAFDMIYGIVYSISLFATVMSLCALLFKYSYAVRLVECACVSDILLALIVIAAKMLDKSSLLRKAVAKLYLVETGSVDIYGDYMGRLAPVCSVIILFLAIAGLLIVYKGRLRKVKYYGNTAAMDVVKLLLPVLFGAVVIQTLKPVLLSIQADAIGGNVMVAETFLMDYFMADDILFNLPLVGYVLVYAVGEALVRRYAVRFKRYWFPALLAGIVAVYGTAIAVNVLNPPRLFGYLTLDEAVCDATESAYVLYMLIYVAEVLMMVIMMHGCIKKELRIGTLLLPVIGYSVFIGVSIPALHISLSCSYIICLIAAVAVIVLQTLLNTGYIRGRHH